MSSSEAQQSTVRCSHTE